MADTAAAKAPTPAAAGPTAGSPAGPTVGSPGAIAGWLAALSFVVLVHGVWWVGGDTVVHFGNLADSDGYARLLRVERLLAGTGWFDVGQPRANWPFGGALHWTRPLDVLLIAVALPMQPFLGMAKALYWSGAFVGPLLHLGAAAALAWAARPLIGGTAALIAAGLTATQFGVLGYATIGHADHHVLLALLAVVAFGFTVRALAADAGTRPAVLAGLALAAGNWVGAEAQIPAALSMVALGLAWVAGDGRAGEKSLGLVLGLVGGLAAAILIERGPAGFFAVEYDRVSVVHLTQAALIAVFWSAVASLRRRGREPTGPMTRLLAAVGAAAVALLVMRFIFPRILVNPLKDFDPVILRIFDGVSEYAPIADVWHFLLYVGSVLPALPWMLRRFRREWAGAGRWAWFLVASAAAVYVVLALGWIRWSLYAGLFLLVGLADLIVAVDAAIDRRYALPERLPVKIAAVVLLAVGPLVAGTAGVLATGEPGADAKTMPKLLADDPRPCPVKRLSRFLETPPWRDRPRAILASANAGAELLYRTRHRVTSTLHHRNAPGILDGVRILGGTDAAAIRELIGKRQVELIVLCRFGADDVYFWKGRGDDVFYRRLERGDLPAWLAEVALPADLKPWFRLFRVTGPG